MSDGHDDYTLDAFQPTEHDWDEAQAVEEDFCVRVAQSLASDVERTDLATLNRFLEKHGLYLAKRENDCLIITHDHALEPVPF